MALYKSSFIETLYKGRISCSETSLAKTPHSANSCENEASLKVQYCPTMSEAMLIPIIVHLIGQIFWSIFLIGQFFELSVQRSFIHGIVRATPSWPIKWTIVSVASLIVGQYWTLSEASLAMHFRTNWRSEGSLPAKLCQWNFALWKGKRALPKIVECWLYL